ncbi:MAG: hypothetical protein HOL66_05755 [Rhodospirillaceae bacterium]|jgi:hypothetical protein|nr:hypothetical protein [Rhodospirillaceae bacterium]MBT5243728.1 hypothetical protein [Rhodospirillaceae bacterium]MBT5563825.1 hypothetical protein [Rhodospirillaceae bacterium]MBT6241686.1 hypothetical protein [Rhodospirillaceae bacterium]MBT7138176.1 hypothetical protein [Rhodospirillaceae bacterium]
MTIIPAAPPVNFNLAVETLKRTLRQDKVAAAALSQAQAPPVQAGQDDDISGVGSDSNRGQHINTDA